MSDFESRLGAALADGAEGAPGAGGLAGAARRRAAARRRRRVVAGAAVAVVVAAAPVGLLAADPSDGPDRPPSVADSTASTVEWRTVSASEVSIDLPADWVELEGSTCANVGDGWGPAGTDPCQPVVRAVPPTELGWTNDVPTPGLAPGATSGFVQVGAVVVFVSDRGGLDHDTARRVLASARPEGEPAPEVAEWETVPVLDGVVADRPVGGDVEVTYDADQSLCVPSPAIKIDGVWVATTCPSGRVVVTATTHALADVVSSSVREGAVDGWTTVSVADVKVDVPPGWQSIECESGITWIVPSGETCEAEGPRVILIDEASTRYGGPSLDVDVGSVVAASQIVSVEDAPFETIRRILASARPAGTPVADLTEWQTIRVASGFVTDVPVGDTVAVRGQAGVFDCNPGFGDGSSLRPDGRWVGAYCGDRFIATVEGPTQALTDVVTLSVRPTDDVEGPDEDVEWTTVTIEGVSVDVPPGWARADCPGFVVLPAGSGTCNDEAFQGLTISSFRDSPFTDPHFFPIQGSGSVYVSDRTVRVFGTDGDTARRILASARPAGTTAPDVDSWRTIELGDGITAEIPDDPAVEVRVSSGAAASCAAQRGLAGTMGYVSWTVGLCGDSFVTVTAPTQALADLVAIQVEGY